ncbi:MAG: T9SS type A sorting domain-containing protein [Bacteroidota bacterium]
MTIAANSPLTGAVSGLSGVNKLTGAGDFSSGVADLTTLGMTYTGNATSGTFTATAATGGYTGTSASVTINGGTATKLVITGSTTQTAGTSQNLTITAQDANGNTASPYTGSKNLTFSGANSSTNPVTVPTVTNSSGTAIAFGSTTAITFSSGVATVSGSNNGVMTLYKAESATISATDGSINSSGSDRLSVTVSAGSLNKFVFSLTSPQTNGSAFTGTNTLTAEDAYGNTVTAFDASANNVTIAANSPLTGAVSGLSGGNKLTGAGDFVSGVATLTTLTYTGNATSGTFTASSATGGYTGTSGSVTINGGTATKLVITGSTTQTAGTSQNLTITAQDANGNTASPYTGSKNLTFSGANSSTNPVTAPMVTNSSGTAIAFGSTTAITFSSGVATVSGSNNGVMTLYKAENATIHVTDGTVSSTGYDLSVAVSSAALNNFVWSLASPQTSGTAFNSGTNTLTARDAYGNTVTGFDASANQVTITANPADGTITGLGSGSNNVLNQLGDFTLGVADVHNKMIFTGTAGSHTFIATSADSKTGTSASVMINAPLYVWNGPGSDWQVASNWTPSRTSPATNDILQFNGGATVTDVPTQTIGQLLLSNSSTVNLQAATAGNTLTVNDILTTTSGDVLNLGSGLLLGGTLTTLTNNGKIQTSVLLATSVTPIPAGKTWGGTVEYNGSGAQTAVGGTYTTLKINNSTGVALAAAATVTTLTVGDVTSSSIFDDGGYQVTSTGTLNLTSGTYKLGSATVGTTFPEFTTRNISSGTTVEYASVVAQTVSVTPSYQNLTFSGGGTKTPSGGTLTIGGNWTVGSPTALNTNNPTVTVTGNLTKTADLTAGSSAISIGGNWTDNGGTFTPGSGTVTFNGSATQNINGSATTQTFNNVTMSGAGGVTVGGSTTTLAIGGTMSITSSASLEIPSTYTLTFSSGASISTGSGKIILDEGSNYINLTSSTPMLQVRTTLTGVDGWRMLSAPDNVAVDSMFAPPLVTQGFTGSSYSTLQPNLLWWDETSQGTSLQAWRSPSATTDGVTLGRGYMFYVFAGTEKSDTAGKYYSDVLPLRMTATGTEYPLTTAFDFHVTATPRPLIGSSATTYVDTNRADYGWNLVGNPTPSTIDWDASSGWTRPNMDLTIYVWDPSISDYKTWDGSTGNLGSGKIAPFQAFWVKANAASPQLTVANGVKSTGGSFLGKINAGVGKLAAVAADSIGKKDTSVAKSASLAGAASVMKDTSSIVSTPVLELELSANGLQKHAYLMFSHNGKLTYDPYDAFSLVPLSDKYLILYSVAGQGQPAMQIQSLPDTGFGDPLSLPLYVGGTTGTQPFSGSFNLTWKMNGQLPTGWVIKLMDDSTGKAYTMTTGGELAFRYDTPTDLVPSAGAFLQKKSGAGSNQRSMTVLPWPVVHTVPAAKLFKGTSASRFRLVVSAHDNLDSYLPSTPELAQNYPNPFNPSTNIQFSVPSRSRVTIQIFNILGQKYTTVTDQEYPAGRHVVVWTPRGASSGVYYCRMIVGKNVQTKKMILLK